MMTPLASARTYDIFDSRTESRLTFDSSSISVPSIFLRVLPRGGLSNGFSGDQIKFLSRGDVNNCELPDGKLVLTTASRL
jgi:hypothetical protein